MNICVYVSKMQGYSALRLIFYGESRDAVRLLLKYKKSIKINHHYYDAVESSEGLSNNVTNKNKSLFIPISLNPSEL